jgi:hypothetical protein
LYWLSFSTQAADQLNWPNGWYYEAIGLLQVVNLCVHVMRRACPRLQPFAQGSQCIRITLRRPAPSPQLWARHFSQIPRQRPPIFACPRFCRAYARQVPVPQAKSISQTEYELRRTLLIDSLPEGSVCVLVGAGIKYASDSVLYPSRPTLKSVLI